ncbi:MAG: hypothetical protein Kow00107_01980 [Planctomycetota bacterium]
MDEWVMDIICRVIPHCRAQFIPEHIKMSIERLRSELSLHPLDVSRHIQLALLYFQVKEFGRAIQSVKTARDLDVRCNVAYLPLLQGVCHLMLGEFPLAERSFQEYRALRPERYEGHLFSSICSFLSRREHEAEQSIKLAMNLESRSFNSRIAQAKFFEAKQNFDSAIMTYESIVRQDPSQKNVFQMIHHASRLKRETERIAQQKKKPDTSRNITLGDGF